MYISYLRDFLVGKVGDLTYDFEPLVTGLPGRLRLPGLGDRDGAARSGAAATGLTPTEVAFIAGRLVSLYGLIQFSY